MEVWAVVKTVYSIENVSTSVEIVGIYDSEEKAAAKQDECFDFESASEKTVDVYVENFDVE